LPDVRFTPKSGHWNSVVECLLCANSGHRRARLSGGGVVAAMNSTDTPHRHRRSRKEAACEGNGAALYDDAPDAAE